MSKAKAGAVLPSGKTRASLNRAEFHQLCKMIEDGADISAGVVAYRDDNSDASIAKRLSERFDKVVPEASVANARRQMFGHLYGEGGSLKSRVSTLQNHVMTQERRIKDLERRLSAIEPKPREVIRPVSGVSNGQHQPNRHASGSM